MGASKPYPGAPFPLWDAEENEVPRPGWGVKKGFFYPLLFFRWGDPPLRRASPPRGVPGEAPLLKKTSKRFLAHQFEGRTRLPHSSVQLLDTPCPVGDTQAPYGFQQLLNV